MVIVYSVYDIRGNHGSGKSTIVRYLLDKWDNKLVLDGVVPYHYVYGINLVVLGRYDMKMGGADNVKDIDKISGFVESMLENHNVLLEGAVISRTFKRWYNISQSSNCENYRVYYLTLDADSCIDRIIEHRKGTNKENQEIKTDNLYKQDKAIAGAINKLENAGIEITRLEDLSVEEEYDWIMSDILADFDRVDKYWLNKDMSLNSVIDIRGTHGSGKTTLIKWFCKNQCVYNKDEVIPMYEKVDGGVVFIPNLSRKLKGMLSFEIKPRLLSILEQYSIVIEDVPSTDMMTDILIDITELASAYTILWLNETNEECYRRQLIKYDKKGIVYSKLKIVSETNKLDEQLIKFMKTRATMLVQSKRTIESGWYRLAKLIKEIS